MESQTDGRGTGRDKVVMVVGEGVLWGAQPMHLIPHTVPLCLIKPITHPSVGGMPISYVCLFVCTVLETLCGNECVCASECVHALNICPLIPIYFPQPTFLGIT